MTVLETKILNAFEASGEYRYSSDLSTKAKEVNAIKNLEKNGFISIRTQTIGYCVADVL